MSHSTGVPEDTIVTFHVKSAGDNKYTISLPLSTTTIDLKNKLSTEEYANVPASSQRLIYSGRVLKDGDTLASHNVKEGNTMHLVKSAASNQRQNPQTSPSSATSVSAPPTGVPTNMAAGSGNTPLAGLTGARYAGFAQLPSAEMFGQDGGMGAPPGPEELIRRLQDPNFSQMMREALQNPAVIDMMIQQNPQLRAMGPQARQMLQSPEFIRSMTDPETLRQMAQFQRMMGGGLGGLGGAGGQEAFPAPGVTNTTDPANRDAQNATERANQQQQPQNPFAALMGGPGGQAGQNPFAALMAGAGGQPGGFPNPFGAPQPNNANTSDITSPNAQTQQNPFAALFGNAQPGANLATGATNPFNNMQVTPEMMQAAAQMFGGANQNPDQGATPNPYANLMNMFGGAGGDFGGPPDNRPPEERYATQLGQLNQMGFHDFDRNIQALRRSGGDINGALEWLFSQPGS